MQVTLRCRSNHEWMLLGPCPICGGESATRDDFPKEPTDSTNTFSQGHAESLKSAAPFPMVPGYELHAEIGSGGMGVVYRATQISLGRRVALKVIRAGELANPLDQKRFIVEAELVAKLQHPNIVQVYDVGMAQGGLFYRKARCPV